MAHVKPKKFLGQHFLKDENIARKIAESLSGSGYKKVLEIGPGMGVLTQFLLQNPAFETYAIELDKESVEYLKSHYPEFSERLIEGDFLEIDLNGLFNEPFGLTGNFPYNISSQIMFKMLDHRNQIPEMAGMFQKEVAERFSAKPRTKAYGILSVLLQTFYDIEYLFTVHEDVFIPPPKVKSGVVRAVRNSRNQLPVSEKLYFDVIKTAFNQRRKTLRNSLKKFGLPDTFWAENNMEKSRPEELNVEEFINLTQLIEKSR